MFSSSSSSLSFVEPFPALPPPESFLCSITNDVMKDPVIDSDGNSFERAALIEWLTVHHSSPITRNFITIDSLKPNRALKDAIEEWKKRKEEEQEQKQQQEQLQEAQPMQISSSASFSSFSSFSSFNEQDFKLQVKLKANANNLVVSLIPSESLESLRAPSDSTLSIRTPSVICCVVDISGSMQLEAGIKNQSGEVESYGLSRLDLVVHALRTLIHSLNRNDKFALVTFNRDARTVLPLVSMDEHGKKRALDVLTSLVPTDQTNLWTGLNRGLDLLFNEQASRPFANSSLFLLTDGQPNIVPPRDHLPTLLKYKEAKNFHCRIHTFGFGYDLDSELLDQIAQVGSGSYAFIPDASFVGTVFVHAIANCLTTVANNVTFNLQLDRSSSFILNKQQNENEAEIPNENEKENEKEKRKEAKDLLRLVNHCKHDDHSITVNVGSVVLGQTRDIVVPIQCVDMCQDENEPIVDSLKVSMAFKYSSPFAQSFIESAFESEVLPNLFTYIERQSAAGSRAAELPPAVLSTAQQSGLNNVFTVTEYEEQVLVQYYRMRLVSELRSALDVTELASMKKELQSFVDELLVCPIKTNSFIQKMLQDLLGQIKEAISCDDYFKRWGRHYLRSFCNAHALQLANNFKDHSVQGYGLGKSFNFERDQLDNLFNKLPAPVSVSAPAPKPNQQPSSSFSAAQVSRPIVTMSTFNSADRGCFHGDGRVLMKDGTTKRVQDLKCGDLVAGPNGGHATIRFVVESQLVPNTNEHALVNIDMVALPGTNLVITPYHPVRLNGEWKFPIDLSKPKLVTCSSVFNFVLNSIHIMLVDGVQCITMGHSCADSPVVTHPYFGSDLIVRDLQKLDPNNTGHVALHSRSFVRDPATGLICGIVQ